MGYRASGARLIGVRKPKPDPPFLSCPLSGLDCFLPHLGAFSQAYYMGPRQFFITDGRPYVQSSWLLKYSSTEERINVLRCLQSEPENQILA